MSDRESGPGYSRTAYLLGEVSAEARGAFDAALSGRVADLIRAMPGVSRVEVHFADRRDEGAPEIYAALIISYASAAEMERALASPIRQEMQAAFREILPAFTGRILHVNAHIR